MAGNETGGQIQRRIVGCQFLLIQWSAIIFSMAEPTRWKKFWESFWPGLILTFLVIGLLLFPRRCEVWALLSTGPLNELGDFLAGVFTPAALVWLIYGYFLQSKELGLQSKELGLQREELEETRKTLGQQVEVLQEQADVELQRSRPNLFLGERGRSNDKRMLVLQNSGAPAHNLEITFWEDGELKEKFPYPEVLRPDKEVKFDILDAPASSTNTFIKACFISERYERLYQRWEITFRYPAEIQQITTGPELLKEGSALAS